MLLGVMLVPGDVVCLEGELGSGKTVMVRGILRGRGFEGAVPSPTFTLMRSYPDQQVCHVDAFRLDDADEMLEAGIEEYLDGEWICAVEWAEKVRAAIPEEALEVRLAFRDEDNERSITLEGPGKWERLSAILKEEFEADAG